MSQQTEVKINDIFYASWGYDQTNIDFVKVIDISKTGKTVKAVSIGQKMIEGSQGFMSEKVAPDPDNIISKEPVKLHIKNGYSNPNEIILRGSYHYSTDGMSKHLGTLWRYDTPMYQSHYA